MSAVGDRFTQVAHQVRPHLDALRVRHKNAHLAMYETITAECHGRSKVWTVTTKTLIGRLMRDTARETPPNIRRTQQVIRDLERWGLVRRHCAETGLPLQSMPEAHAKRALRSARGLRYEIAGLDYPVPPFAEFQKWISGDGVAVIAPASVDTPSTDPPKLVGVRASSARSKEDGSLDLPPPSPSGPSARQGRERTDAGAVGIRDDHRLPQLVETVNRLHRERSCREVERHEVVKSLAKAALGNPGVPDIVKTFEDIFTRFAAEVPMRLGQETVQSPLRLMASRRDLENFQPSRAPQFSSPPPPMVVMSAEENRRRDRETKELFALLDSMG